MSLPTLWIAEPIVTDDGRAYWLSSEPFPGKVAYVPRADLDAANEALRVANAEIARLRTAAQKVVSLYLQPEYNGESWGDDGVAERAIEALAAALTPKES